MRELMREVLTSFMSNKMRTILTGLAMGWGVFILIVLISSGNGIVNGMHYNFRAYNIGMVTLTPRETSLSFGGKERGWPVYFFEEDCDLLKKRFGDTIAQTIPVISRPVRAHREKYYTNTIIDGYRPGYAPAPNVQLAEGRDINDLDLQQMRKVCLIPKRLKPVLFPEDTTSVIGRNLIINDVVFEVIGIYECLQTQHLTTSELNVAFNASVVGVLAAQKGFSPSDRRAVKVDNLYDLPMLLNSIISGLYAFVIIVGLATLLTGIVGISNIMLIAVKERTRELGIRRALGAKNRQIVTMVMTESVVISVIFGYVGMIMGIGLMELMAWIVASTGNAHIFYNPTIAVSHALVVMFLMVIVGLIAGYMPAKHAVGMKLTEALSAV